MDGLTYGHWLVITLSSTKRHGESELIERDLSGVEGRGAYRPAAEDFRGRRHSSTCQCVLHSSSTPAVAAGALTLLL